ncbi:hypothetical protein ACSNOI_03725 [Actinomadura kijaniata]|uniref:hypothetical protein n=1 Tax=Actinomadura kijaniata TaxID=46161 RepID=UPI003F19829D
MTTTDIVVTLAQVAAGGGLVQAVVAVMRRRGELRQLDRQSESLAVDTADQLVLMLRRELRESREELDDLRRDRDSLQRRLDALARGATEPRGPGAGKTL